MCVWVSVCLCFILCLFLQDYKVPHGEERVFFCLLCEKKTYSLHIGNLLNFETIRKLSYSVKNSLVAY